ncbi:MAG: hypothetical protein Q9226_009323, partial [Calogaya cf. arnoldii]
ETQSCPRYLPSYNLELSIIRCPLSYAHNIHADIGRPTRTIRRVLSHVLSYRRLVPSQGFNGLFCSTVAGLRMAINGNLLELSLSHPLTSNPLKQQFLHQLFGINVSLDEIQSTDSGYRAFFSRFDYLRNAAANWHRAIDSCTFADFYLIIMLIWSNEKPRRELEKTVAERLHKDIIHSSYGTALIDFAASVSSLMIIGRSAAYNPYDDPVVWDASMFLHPGLNNQQPNLINTVFPPPSFLDTVKLPQSFTAANLEKIGGIQVLWTDNLADHLLLRDDDTKEQQTFGSSNSNGNMV